MSHGVFAEEICSKDYLKNNNFSSDLKHINEAVVEYTMMLDQSKLKFDGYFGVDGKGFVA